VRPSLRASYAGTALLVPKDNNMDTHTASPRRGTGGSLDEQLQRFETARQQQLDAIPTADLDVVTAAYRASVERILDEVRTARQRLAEGRYGWCARCADPIPGVRLEQRPWATTCARCVGRPRW
jgi:RNA polymerase-binding transcription factor DksA